MLTRHGIEVVLPRAQGCCGGSSITWAARTRRTRGARATSTPGRRDRRRGARRHPDHRLGLRHDGQGLRLHAARRSGLCRRRPRACRARAATSANISRSSTCSPQRESQRLVVAYHAACSLQHGQKITRAAEGTAVASWASRCKDVPEGHLCCGSAGTYNILQPDIAKRLRERKVGNIEKIEPDVIAAGNIGCITQIAAGTDIPVVHPVELIDWATGGQCPRASGTGRQTSAVAPVGELGVSARRNRSLGERSWRRSGEAIRRRRRRKRRSARRRPRAKRRRQSRQAKKRRKEARKEERRQEVGAEEGRSEGEGQEGRAAQGAGHSQRAPAPAPAAPATRASWSPSSARARRRAAASPDLARRRHVRACYAIAAPIRRGEWRSRAVRP